ncbi:hypothetical protein ACIRFH_28210 [Streptomyces sp. NPDC093586]|uniref:hypothetical protein n=1 Tax=Streptomyces sp. NPDC093586 TaxID=3366042 RepID=UPI00380BC44D
MFLMTATVPTGAWHGEPALDVHIRQLIASEEQLEHIHIHPSADGEARLTLFLGHPDTRTASRPRGRHPGSWPARCRRPPR